MTSDDDINTAWPYQFKKDREREQAQKIKMLRRKKINRVANCITLYVLIVIVWGAV